MSLMRKTERGFTLIEVMIALAIFAVAVASLSSAMHNNVRNAGYLKDKTVANWIANNKMVEMQAANNYPPLQDRTDKIEYAGAEWIVNTKVQKAATKMPVRIIEINVGVERDGKPSYFATITGLLTDSK